MSFFSFPCIPSPPSLSPLSSYLTCLEDLKRPLCSLHMPRASRQATLLCPPSIPVQDKSEVFRHDRARRQGRHSGLVVEVVLWVLLLILVVGKGAVTAMRTALVMLQASSSTAPSRL